MKDTEIVKRKLWRFGYSVKDYTLIAGADFPFHLLVENKYKVRVVKKIEPKDIMGMSDMDYVLATMEHKKVLYMYRSKSGYWAETFSPYIAFGKKAEKK